MRLLGIDTATEACSVALWSNGHALGRFEVPGRSHTERLRDMVGAVLAEAGVRPSALDGFVCGVGPGGFSGVRIGVAFVQGLAFALDRPVVPITSLELLALRAIHDNADVALAALDARMGEVYFAAYRGNVEGIPQPLLAPRVGPPMSLPALEFASGCGIGSGWGVHGEALIQALGRRPARLWSEVLPDVSAGMSLAAQRLAAGQGVGAHELRPVYLRDRVALTLQEQRQSRMTPK
jgi:tRNA threonylcarbamoyladenosine biosynthesis protein TsaB